MFYFFEKMRMIRNAPILLGRWCRTDKKLNDVKVDLANVDHCGICFHEPNKSKNIVIHKIEDSQKDKKFISK